MILKMLNFAGVFSLALIFTVLSIVFPLRFLYSAESKSRDIRDFDSVSFETRGRLSIIQGNSEYLHIQASEEALRRITATVRGRTLHISYRGIFTGARELPVFTLGMKDIRSIRVLSAGDAVAESIAADDLLIDCGSSGDVSIGSLTARDATVRVSSSGNVTIEGCSVANLAAVLTSSGNFRVKGEAETLFLNLSSSGNAYAGELKAASAEIRVRSSGSAEAWVSDRLIPFLSGKGSLRCFGKPSVEGEKIGGSGTLTFLEE